MDKQEAKLILTQELKRYRQRPYADLAERVLDEPDNYEVSAPSGVRYQVEVMGVWDGEVGGDLRVIGMIDDGGWRAFAPLSDDFIMAPDGSFVDE